MYSSFGFVVVLLCQHVNGLSFPNLKQTRHLVTTHASPNKTPAGSTYCDIEGGSATYNEVIVGDARIITASGCPNHFNACQKKSCTTLTAEAIVVNYTLSIPAYPVLATVSTSTDCETMDIAIALNGVAINGPGSGTGDCSDAITAEGDTFDSGGGHAGTTGHYHYHVPPAEILAVLGDGIAVNGTIPHSVQLGWSYDGFPIYGPYGMNGTAMYPCASNSTLKTASYCLDTCGGWAGELPTIDAFKYRYYFSGPVGNAGCASVVVNGDQGVCQFAGPTSTACCINIVPDPSFYPYTIGCYKGCKYENMATCAGTAGYTYTNATAATSLIAVIQSINGSPTSAPTSAPTSGASSHGHISSFTLVMSAGALALSWLHMV